MKELLELLTSRLGNKYFGIGDLKNFIEAGLSAVNTYQELNISLEDDREDVVQLKAAIVQYAYYMALTTMAIAEKTKEISIIDNGIQFVPMKLSDMLLQVAESEYTHWENIMREVKTSKLNRLYEIIRENSSYEDEESEESDESTDKNNNEGNVN
jgi:hypothetical protein